MPTAEDCLVAAGKAADFQQLLQNEIPDQMGQRIAAVALTSRNVLHADRFRIARSGGPEGHFDPCREDHVLAVLSTLHGMGLGVLSRRSSLVTWERFLTPEEERVQQHEEMRRGKERWKKFQKEEEKHWYDLKSRILQQAGEYAALDADGDGQVSQEELEKGRVFQSLDANKDGRLSKDELRAARN